jgi:hypothetical protein
MVPEAGVPRAGAVNTGAVRVLLVSVSVPVNVTRFVGVIMSDKFAMRYAPPYAIAKKMYEPPLTLTVEEAFDVTVKPAFSGST